MNKKSIFGGGIILLFFVAIFFRLSHILNFDIPFHYDIALNFIEVRNMVLKGDFRLVGPEGGIKGIFFGPTWYYLFAIFFSILNGDPRTLSFLSFTMHITTLFFAFLIGSKINRKVGFFAFFFFAFSSQFIASSISGFVVDTFVLINLIALYFLFPPITKKKLFFLSFLAGISFHFEPVVAIGFNLALLFILFPYVKKMQLKEKSIFLLFWTFPFFPQILFELRHNFLETRAIINELLHFGSGLGGNLPFFVRPLNRLSILMNHFITTTGNGNLFLSLILFFFFFIGIFSFKATRHAVQKSLVSNSLILFLVPLFYYAFLFPPGIKNWYYVSFIALYGIFISLGLSQFCFNRRTKFITLCILILFFFTHTNPFSFVTSLQKGFPSSDPSNLKNTLDIISWIYKDTDQNPFTVYTYSPAIYDYPYQYLFWWYARTYHLPQPQDFSYRPNTFDYVAGKLFFTPMPQSKNSFLIYLIFFPHHPEYHKYWLPEHFFEPFQGTKLITKKIFPGNVMVEKRIKQ